MAPFRLPYCPLNWPIYRSTKFLDWTRAFGQLLYLTKVELTKTQKGGEKKTWSRSEEKVDRLYRTAYSAFSVSERSEGKRRIYSNRKDRVKENSIFQQLFLLGAVSSVILGSFFPLVFKFFSCWTHVEGKRSRHVWFEPGTFSNGKGEKKANENVGDMPEIGGV